MQACDVVGDVTDTLFGRRGRQRQPQAQQTLQGRLIGWGLALHFLYGGERVRIHCCGLISRLADAFIHRDAQWVILSSMASRSREVWGSGSRMLTG